MSKGVQSQVDHLMTNNLFTEHVICEAPQLKPCYLNASYRNISFVQQLVDEIQKERRNSSYPKIIHTSSLPDTQKLNHDGSVSEIMHAPAVNLSPILKKANFLKLSIESGQESKKAIKRVTFVLPEKDPGHIQYSTHCNSFQYRFPPPNGGRCFNDLTDNVTKFTAPIASLPDASRSFPGCDELTGFGEPEPDQPKIQYSVTYADSEHLPDKVVNIDSYIAGEVYQNSSKLNELSESFWSKTDTWWKDSSSSPISPLQSIFIWSSSNDSYNALSTPYPSNNISSAFAASNIPIIQDNLTEDKNDQKCDNHHDTTQADIEQNFSDQNGIEKKVLVVVRPAEKNSNCELVTKVWRKKYQRSGLSLQSKQRPLAKHQPKYAPAVKNCGSTSPITNELSKISIDDPISSLGRKVHLNIATLIRMRSIRQKLNTPKQPMKHPM